MKISKISLAAAVAMGLATSAMAADDLASAFKEAKVNGKVRFNYFDWRWNDMDDYTKAAEPSSITDANAKKIGVNPDSKIAAIGGSLAIKTAPLYKTSIQAEFFTSQPITSLSKNANYAKSGADLDLRDAFNTTKEWNAQTTSGMELEPINVLGIANIQYQIGKTNITLGRQYFDTPMTGTNDSKMVPNTFDGYAAQINDIADTAITLGYIREMKPRNQDQFVGLLDNDSDVNNALRTSGNTTTVSNKLNRPDYLGVVGVVNKSISNLELQGWFYRLDGIIDDVIAEANYKIPVGPVAVTVGARYFKQIDKLGGKLGSTVDVASFDGKAKINGVGGYKDITSLDSDLKAARIIVEYGSSKFQYGYSEVADKADILAPWRGFPTGGYTRPMKIENWDANIKSWMVSYWFDFEKAGLVNGLDINVNYLVDNRDETKIQPKGDMKTITADINYKFTKSLSGRLRMGLHDDKGNNLYRTVGADLSAATTTDNGTLKGWDFTEYRAELVYKF